MPTTRETILAALHTLLQTLPATALRGDPLAPIKDAVTADVEVVQNVLAETQSAILPLVPYLDTLRWVFIVVALIGVSITIYARWDDWCKGRR